MVTWVATQVVTPVRREAMARHSSTTPDLFALVVNVVYDGDGVGDSDGDGDRDYHLNRR